MVDIGSVQDTRRLPSRQVALRGLGELVLPNGEIIWPFNA